MIIAKVAQLVEARIILGWNKSDLARQAGVTHSVIIRAECGKAMSPRSAKAIADALQCPVLELFNISTSEEVVTHENHSD